MTTRELPSTEPQPKLASPYEGPASPYEGPTSPYEGIVEGSLQGIIVQQDERIVYANPAMAKLFAFESAENLIGLNPFEDLVDEHNLDELRARVAAVYRNESVAPHPGWRARRRDGKTVWIA